MTLYVWKDGLCDVGGFSRYDGPEWGYADAPEGWRRLIELDWAGSWEFSTVLVLQNLETGELRAAHDSGCSCPTPYTGLTLDGMKVVREVEDLRDLVTEATNYYVDGGLDSTTDPKVADLKAAVHRALRNGVKA